MNQTKERRNGRQRVLISRCVEAHRRSSEWAVVSAVLMLVWMLIPARAAQAIEPAPGETVHEITWVHEAPAEVEGFVVYLSPVPDSVAEARQIAVGKPGGSNSNTAQFFSALVPVGLEEYVAVAAIGRNGLQSIVSEWRQPQPTQPGQPLVVEP